jgi:hypothetical protein
MNIIHFFYILQHFILPKKTAQITIVSTSHGREKATATPKKAKKKVVQEPKFPDNSNLLMQDPAPKT